MADAEGHQKTLLCFAYYTPPLNEAASLRTKYLVRAALESGWICRVVTIKPNRLHGCLDLEEMEVNPNLEIIRFPTSPKSVADVTNSGRLTRILSRMKPYARQVIRRLPLYYLEPAEYWRRKVAAAIDGGEFDGVDAIWSTSGPVHAHMLACRLSQRRSGSVCWIADYRDPWSGSHFFQLFFGHEWQRRLEKRTLQLADYITCVSAGHAQYLTQLHNRKIEVYYNGYQDSEAGLERACEDQPSDSIYQRFGSDSIIVAYTGTIYEHFDSRKITMFVKQVLANTSRVVFVFFGNDQLGIAKGLFDEPRAVFFGSQPSKKTQLLQDQADFLFFLHEPHKKSGRSIAASAVVSTKAFEYIKSGKPVLAIGDVDSKESEPLRLLGSHNELLYFNYAESSFCVNTIISFLEGQHTYPTAAPEKFSRREIMNNYMKLFRRNNA